MRRVVASSLLSLALLIAGCAGDDGESLEDADGIVDPLPQVGNGTVEDPLEAIGAFNVTGDHWLTLPSGGVRHLVLSATANFTIPTIALNTSAGGYWALLAPRSWRPLEGGCAPLNSTARLFYRNWATAPTWGPLTAGEYDLWVDASKGGPLIGINAGTNAAATQWNATTANATFTPFAPGISEEEGAPYSARFDHALATPEPAIYGLRFYVAGPTRSGEANYRNTVDSGQIQPCAEARSTSAVGSWPSTFIGYDHGHVVEAQMATGLRWEGEFTTSAGAGLHPVADGFQLRIESWKRPEAGGV